MALGPLPACEEGPDRQDEYDPSFALGAAAQEGWDMYEAEETDDVIIIRPPTVNMLNHFHLRGMWKVSKTYD